MNFNYKDISEKFQGLKQQLPYKVCVNKWRKFIQHFFFQFDIYVGHIFN